MIGAEPAQAREAEAAHRAARPESVSPLAMFVVWIVEATDATDAEVVARAARAAPGDHVRLALHDGAVCGVLVARSVDMGVDGIETPATIERFAPALREALRLAHGEAAP